MASVNKVILIGNLGKEPEVRTTQTGGKLANLTLATSESWTNKQTGVNEEKTEWHRLVCFNKTAEIAEKYLKKGSKIYVEGKLNTRKWTDKTGQERYTTEITIDNFTMLDSKQASNDNTPTKQPAKVSSEPPFDDTIPF